MKTFVNLENEGYIELIDFLVTNSITLIDKNENCMIIKDLILSLAQLDLQKL